MSENETGPGSGGANHNPDFPAQSSGSGQPPAYQPPQPPQSPWAPQPSVSPAAPTAAQPVTPASDSTAQQPPVAYPAQPTLQQPAAQDPSGGAHPTLYPTAAPSSTSGGWAPTSAYPPSSPAWQPGQPLPGHGPYPPAPGTGVLAGPTPAPGQSAGMRRMVVAGVAAVAIALGAGGVGGFVGYALHGDSAASSPLQNVSTNKGGTAPIVDRSSLASIAASVQPTVVDIVTGSAEGSGVVISGDGYIVTNNHVVASAQGSTVKVTFNSGKRIDATIVGTDPKTDLAVVKANVTGLTAATWGDSDKVQVGDTVLAIGSPLGLQSSVTAGIISALHRTITVGGEQQNQFEPPAASTTIGDAIQTDAPINPGNSGGALVDTEGHVVGINSAIATAGSNGNVGVGFAISANKARSVSQQLIKGGKVSHPYLGVSVGDAQNGGAQIQQLVAGGPAAKAGLREGDVVTKVNSTPIAGSEDLVGAIQASSVGAQLTLTIDRSGSESTVTVTVGEAP